LFQGLLFSILQGKIDGTKVYAKALVPQIAKCRPSTYKRLKRNLLDDGVTLDSTTVAEVLEDLQDEFGLTYLFIAHDLSVVRHISDEIAVMYFGKLVEFGPSESVFNHPGHPYTEALLSAVPYPDPRKKLEAIRFRPEDHPGQEAGYHEPFRPFPAEEESMGARVPFGA